MRIRSRTEDALQPVLKIGRVEGSYTPSKQMHGHLSIVAEFLRALVGASDCVWAVLAWVSVRALLYHFDWSSVLQ